MSNSMKKKTVKITIFIVATLVVLLLVLFMNSSIFKGNSEAKSKTYTSFVASVQTLNKTIDQAIKAASDEKAVCMFDAYTSMLFMNQRFDLLIEQADSIQQSTTLQNDLFLLSNLYQAQVRNQLSKQEAFNLEAHRKLKEQLDLFIAELPDQYDTSKGFIEQFGKAAAHIKPLINGGM